MQMKPELGSFTPRERVLIQDDKKKSKFQVLKHSYLKTLPPQQAEIHTRMTCRMPREIWKRERENQPSMMVHTYDPALMRQREEKKASDSYVRPCLKPNSSTKTQTSRRKV